MATTSKTTMTKAELEAKVAELEALLAQAQAGTPAPVAPTFSIPTTDVTLVYTSSSIGVIKYSNGELYCTRFGEEFVLPRSAFDEIVGRYRHWFEAGILAVSYKNIDVAAAKGLPTDKEYGLTASDLGKLGSMTASQIEKLWNSLPKPGLKESVIHYFKRKFIEDAPGYRDRERVDTLNRLSNGGLKVEIDQLSGRTHVAPTDLQGNSKDVVKVL